MHPNVPFQPEDPGEGLPPVPPAGAPREPIAATATWVTLTTAVLTALVAFAVPVTEAQPTAIIGLVAVVAPIILAIVARNTVWAPATVAKVVAAERQKAFQGRPPDGA